MVFMERDDSFFKEVDKLGQAMMMYGEGLGLNIEDHQVLKMAVDTGLARQELCVAQLSHERFLIHLPKGLRVKTFIKALSKDLWDQGFTFQQWS